MPILIGILLALVLLYFWLQGHWYARILTAIILIPLLAFIVATMLAGAAVSGGAIHPEYASGLAFLGAVVGGVAGWFAAGTPVYYWRQTPPTMATPMCRIHELTYEHLAPPPASHSVRWTLAR
jgi:peptidoglycan/LPS O-acetylase OafA/YrhL